MAARLTTSRWIIQAQEEKFLGTFDDLVFVDGELETAVELSGDASFTGVIACTDETGYHFTVVDSAVQHAQEFGLNVEAFGSEPDVEKQMSAIETFITHGAQVIVVCLFDPPDVKLALKEVAGAGVLVAQLPDRQLAEIHGVTTSVEDAHIGSIAGAYAAPLNNEEMDGQTFVAIPHYPDLPNFILQAEAIRKALEASAPDTEIVGNFLGGTTGSGLAPMDVALSEHSEVNVVIHINDAGAYGALHALENAGADEAIGVGAEAYARDQIQSGTFFWGTVDTVPAVTGMMTVNAAVKLLVGGEIPQHIEVSIEFVTAE